MFCCLSEELIIRTCGFSYVSCPLNPPFDSFFTRSLSSRPVAKSVPGLTHGCIMVPFVAYAALLPECRTISYFYVGPINQNHFQLIISTVSLAPTYYSPVICASAVRSEHERPYLRHFEYYLGLAFAVLCLPSGLLL